MTGILKKIIPASWKQNFKIKLGAPHMYWSLANMAKNGFKPQQIIDVGAYKGEFSRDVLSIFPDAGYLLLEANPLREEDLKRFVSKHKDKKISYEIALIGSAEGMPFNFSLMGVASSALEEHFETNADRVEFKTRTIDSIVKEKNFNNVSFIKLDVQGFELEVLKGGLKCLQMAEAVLLEVNLLDIHKECPLMHDIVTFMFDHGFVAYDICSVAARRPLDMALWQTDIIFVKINSALRSDKRYALK